MTAILSALSWRAWLAVAAIAWGVLAPVGVRVWTKATAAIERHQAVAATRRDEQQQCSQRIADLRKEIDDAANAKVADALDAAGRLEPTPADAAELGRLCQRDRWCRGSQR